MKELILFHGTPKTNVDSILREGLRPVPHRLLFRKRFEDKLTDSIILAALYAGPEEGVILEYHIPWDCKWHYLGKGHIFNAAGDTAYALKRSLPAAFLSRIYQVDNRAEVLQGKPLRLTRLQRRPGTFVRAYRRKT